MAVGPARNSYHEGYLEGLKDTPDYLKFIPKKEIKNHIESLQEDVRTIYRELYNFNPEEAIVGKYKYYD